MTFDYEAYKAARVERYRNRATRAGAEAAAAYEASRAAVEHIPTGQPILMYVEVYERPEGKDGPRLYRGRFHSDEAAKGQIAAWKFYGPRSDSDYETVPVHGTVNP